MALTSFALALSLSAPAAISNEFSFAVTVENQADQPLNLWIPVASDSELQDVSEIRIKSEGGAPVLTVEPEYGNRMAFLTWESAPANVTVEVTYSVKRWTGGIHNVRRDLGSADRFLKGDRLVPLGDRYAEIAGEVVKRSTSISKVRSIYDHVIETMEYDYKKESPKLGEGDVAFVCDYKRGNCSDLHSYVISLARTIGIPAYLEYGFPITGIPIPESIPAEGEIGGYHCWTWFYDSERGWLPLDASDGRRWLDSGKPDIKDLLARSLVLERSAVAVSKGRDITLFPPQSGGKLNTFIKPHAEQNGESIPANWKVRYKRL